MTKDDRPIGNEYGGERDMEAFWREVAPRKEPTRVPWLLGTVLLITVMSVPWYRSAGEIGTVVWGFPVWVWTSIVCTLAVSALTAVGILRFWHDDEDGD